MSEEDDDKPFDPSQRKLDEARKKGEIVRSVDANSALGYAGLMLVCLVAGKTIIVQAGGTAQAILEQADRFSSQATEGARALLAPVFTSFATILAPIFVLPFAAVLLGLIAQKAIVFAPEKLSPKLSRLSPMATAKQKFGREGLFEFAKNTLKMIAVSAVLALHLRASADDIAASLYLSPAQGASVMVRLMVEFLGLILCLSILVGGLDYFWQRSQHMRRLRMSFQEMIDEHKESEGDPHAKGQRRQKAQEIALNQMLKDVDKADVVIVNPTHYAVALRWKRGDKHAPICVAKGVDEVAARIRERAILAGVPLHSDPPTARAIFASVDVGAPIRAEQYKPVAAAIRFAESLKKRRRLQR